MTTRRNNMSQLIPVNCPGCGYATQVPIEMAGQNAQCPSCQTIVTISAVGMPAAAPFPPQPYGTPSVGRNQQARGSGALVGWIVGGIAAAAAITVTLILTLGGEDGPSSASGGSSSYTSSLNSNVQREIQQAAVILNRNTPQRMDEYTELVAVEAGPMELIYKYRVSINLNRGQWQQVESVVRQGIRSNAETRNLLDMNVKMTYEYRGPTGSIGHRFTVR